MEDKKIMPESVQLYFKDTAIETAVDKLLEKEWIPDLSDWKSLCTYHEAVFSAYRVQYDWALFSRQIMEEVFFKCIGYDFNKNIISEKNSKKIKGFRPLGEWDTKKKPTLSNIWEGDYGLICYFQLHNSKNYIGFIVTNHEDSSSLYLGIWTDKKDKIKKVWEDWEKDKDKEDWWYLKNTPDVKELTLKNLEDLRKQIGKVIDWILS